MALSDDLRERVVGAVVEGGMSRNAAAKRFGVSIASVVRWVARFNHASRGSGPLVGGRGESTRSAGLGHGFCSPRNARAIANPVWRHV